jgi:hypothetical protein
MGCIAVQKKREQSEHTSNSIIGVPANRNSKEEHHNPLIIDDDYAIGNPTTVNLKPKGINQQSIGAQPETNIKEQLVAHERVIEKPAKVV